MLTAQGLSCSLCSPVSKEAGGAQEAGSQQLTQTDQSDIPYYMVSCSAITAGGKREEDVDIQNDGIYLHKKLSFAFLEMAEHLPANGSSEWIPCFAFLTHEAFALPG